MPGKRVQFDNETWNALDLLARDRMMDFQELADEAFRDLLRKHNRPTDLKAALRQSAGQTASVHKLQTKRGKRNRRTPQIPLAPMAGGGRAGADALDDGPDQRGAHGTRCHGQPDGLAGHGGAAGDRGGARRLLGPASLTRDGGATEMTSALALA